MRGGRFSRGAHLGKRLTAACSRCDDGEGVIFLSDMLGGSPFREAANIALARPGYEVITGTNLQMAVEMMLDRQHLDTETFRDRALECGQCCITSLWHQQHRSAPVLSTESGI
ncbi:PTS galactosamine/N-acetylgalactosamine transporter subunit IIA [Sodalis glossinidius]|uniref:PTS sugar transporter subunit IIA domain-containing protein n=1 Tax=Sodalis glossinidius TaxID=63612 RepID=UPI0002D66D57